MSDEKIYRRLRQVLELLANAQVEHTTIPDPNGQGNFEGPDRFVSVEIIEDAKALLADWDEEDTRAEAP